MKVGDKVKTNGTYCVDCPSECRGCIGVVKRMNYEPTVLPQEYSIAVEIGDLVCIFSERELEVVG
jgi:hypothetical protein